MHACALAHMLHAGLCAVFIPRWRYGRKVYVGAGKWLRCAQQLPDKNGLGSSCWCHSIKASSRALVLLHRLVRWDLLGLVVFVIRHAYACNYVLHNCLCDTQGFCCLYLDSSSRCLDCTSTRTCLSSSADSCSKQRVCCTGRAHYLYRPPVGRELVVRA